MVSEKTICEKEDNLNPDPLLQDPGFMTEAGAWLCGLDAGQGRAGLLPFFKHTIHFRHIHLQ